MRNAARRVILPFLATLALWVPAAGAEELPAGFSADAFRDNFAAGLVGKPNTPPLNAADVRLEAAEKAVNLGGLDIYAVKGEIAPAQGQRQPFVLFVSADGRYFFSDVVDMRAGKSVLKDARDHMHARDLKNVGHTVFKGTGKTTVTFVSDPFCPYCREAFSYLMGKSAQYGEFRLAHFPLSSHAGADIACALMAWAADKAPKRLADFVRFAYLELPVPHPHDRSPEQREKALIAVADAFRARFPELASLGKDGKAIVTALRDSPYAEAVAKDLAQAAGMDITGTPVVFVGDQRVDGFNGPRLDSLLK
jgi:protein-disulfide isomerase